MGYFFIVFLLECRYTFYYIEMNKGILAIPGVIVVVVIAIIVANSVGNKEGECIVTIFDKRYDVTELRSTHSGGDVYECGTDMSADFESEHGTNVQRIQQYLIP